MGLSFRQPVAVSPLRARSGQSQTSAPTLGRFLQRAGWSRPV